MSEAMDLDKLTTLVVGLDSSETSRRAAQYALTIARGTGAKVIFVQVLNTATLMGLAPAALPGAQQAAVQTADETEARIREALAGDTVEWELCRFEGNPFVELCRVAEERNADGIVVGASMRAAHRLIGSLPIHLVKSHRWPVTVVP